jgi:hypothetical protein
MTADNKTSGSKTKGIFALILAIVLTLGFLGNLKGILKSFVVILKLFSGQVDAYQISYAISYLLFPSLILYGAIKLFSYSNKNLFKKNDKYKQPADQI